MDTLQYILGKFDIDPRGEMPIEIPNMGRDKMAGILNELGFKVGAEIGVCDGTYSEVLCKNIPNLKLYGIEYGEAYAEYRDIRLRRTFAKFMEDARIKLAPYDFTLVKKMSMDAVKDFADNSLDFVYIDANHTYSYVLDDITEWTKKVRAGGVIYGHDYDSHAVIANDGSCSPIKSPTRKNWKVKEAIIDYTQQNDIRPWFILGLFKDLPTHRARSWCFIKQ